MEARELDRDLWAQNGADAAVLPACIPSRGGAAAASAPAVEGAARDVDEDYAALSSDSGEEKDEEEDDEGEKRTAVDPPGLPPAHGSECGSGAVVAYELAASGVTQLQLATEHEATITEMDSVLDSLAAWREERRDAAARAQQQACEVEEQSEGEHAEEGTGQRTSEVVDLLAQRQLTKLAEQRRAGGMEAAWDTFPKTASRGDAAPGNGDRDSLRRMLGGRDSAGRRDGAGTGASSSSRRRSDAMRSLDLERTRAALQAEMMAAEEDDTNGGMQMVSRFEADLDDVLQRLAATESGGAKPTNQSASEAEEEKRTVADSDEDDDDRASESKSAIERREEFISDQ